MTNHIRHSEIFDASRLGTVLIGAGGIGAATALALAKMGVRYLEVWDDDFVSEENLATQLHRLSDVGMEKVFALKDLLAEFSDDTYVEPVPGRVTAQTGISGQIIISAVDSIAARKAIWAALGNFDWYIDARMGAEIAQIFCLEGRGDDSWYADMLAGQDDASVEDAPCTRRATFFCASAIAGILGSLVRKVATRQDLPRVINFDLTTFVSTVIWG